MTCSSSNRPSEFDLIAQLFAPLATDAGAFGLADDVATLTPPPGMEVVLKADAIVEGVHFLPDDPPDLVARKALRVNLSDLAAKGAEPIGYLLSFSISDRTSMEWLTAFARGLGEDQKEFAISLLGGDTTSTPGPTTISITMVGAVQPSALIRRNGARPGDLVFVSGTIGDAGAGLAILKGSEVPEPARSALVSRYRLPLPRLALGQALSGIASASLDVSDGLIADLGHIAETSGVRIAVDAARIPQSPELRELWGTTGAAIVRAATAGDDFEIAFTAPPTKRDAVMAKAAKARTPVTEIGQVMKGRGVALLDSQGHEIAVPKPGYTHF